MIGVLPKSLQIDGVDYAIRSDFRVVLNIFEAFNDTELNEKEKVIVMLKCLYVVVPDDMEKAAEKAVWFIDGGGSDSATTSDNKPKSNVKLIDWEQDEQIIFSAVNKVAGKEIRSEEYLHWWTFLGFFNEIGEGLFSTVLNIRSKKAKGKKLEKYEQDFYKQHKEMIDIKKKYTEDEKQEMARLNDIFR